MARHSVGRALDEAVRDHRITVVHGLPRVGRSRAITSWCATRSDAQMLGAVTPELGFAPIRIIDHLSLNDAGAFIAQFRAIDADGEDVRFVVVPVELQTVRTLQEQLAGSVNLFIIDPLQPDDVAAEQLAIFSSAGPTTELMATPGPTNAAPTDPDLHWLRGGLPDSLAADTDAASLAWRRQMINNLLVSDYTSWGITSATKLHDILRWVANLNGAEFDEHGCPIAKRGELLSVLHVFDRLGLTRRLPNFPAGTNAALGKKPKLMIRDAGVLHAMLGVETVAQLRTHPAIGESFESYAIEALITAGAGRCTPQFYREQQPGVEGADEIDLLLDFRPLNGRLVAIECKTSPDRAAKAGFHRGFAASGATDGFVVHAGTSSQLGSGIDRLHLAAAVQRVAAIAQIMP